MTITLVTRCNDSTEKVKMTDLLLSVYKITIEEKIARANGLNKMLSMFSSGHHHHVATVVDVKESTNFLQHSRSNIDVTGLPLTSQYFS